MIGAWRLLPSLAPFMLAAALAVGAAHPLVAHIASPRSHTPSEEIASGGVVALTALAALGLLPLLSLIIGVTTLLTAARRANNLMARGTPAEACGIRYIRVPVQQPALFTTGLRQPAIVVTAGAERSLTSEQLAAALQHEFAHMRRHEPAMRAALHLVESGFGLLPGVRSAVSSMILQSEAAADREAVNSGASPTALFDAIITVSSSPALAATGLDGAPLLRRLALLAEPGGKPSRPPILGPTVIAVWSLALPAAAHALVWAGVACYAGA